jgi:hypothetical protein
VKITHNDKSHVKVGIEQNEASLLLQGLEEQRGELGAVAEELIKLLRSKGIVPPPNPDHIRTEYAGPEGAPG